MPGFDDRTVGDALAEVASSGSPPAGGVASALTCATAAALVELTAVLAADRFAAEGGEVEARMRDLGWRASASRERMLAAADEDADAYARVIAADEPAARAAALGKASEPPFEVARTAAEVAEGAAEVAAAGDWPFTADALVAARLAAAAAASAADLVATNLSGRADEDPRVDQAREAAERARVAAG